MNPTNPSSVDATPEQVSRVFILDDGGGVTVPMDHPLVKAMHKSVREKQEAREREERRHYVDPRDIRFVMGGKA